MESQLHMIEISGSAETCALLNEILTGMNLQPSLWSDPDGGEGRVSIYCASRAQAEDLTVRLREVLERVADVVPPDTYTVRSSSLTDKDWAESWKRTFTVERIGAHIVICPPWEHAEVSDGDMLITINPGMAFGTGRHATTKACLELLEELGPQGEGRSLLDAGCGSGIQSITARKLGYRPVDAFDNYPCAVETTRRHCMLNGVAADVNAFEADLDTFEPERAYDVVIANILYDVLSRNAERLARCARPGGIVIGSGVMTGRYTALVREFRAVGLHEEQRLTVGEWTTGKFRRVD